MISVLNAASQKYDVSGVDDKEIYCLSTDTKPTVGMKNGYKLLEIDTGDVYIFNETAGTWKAL